MSVFLSVTHSLCSHIPMWKLSEVLLLLFLFVCLFVFSLAFSFSFILQLDTLKHQSRIQILSLFSGFASGSLVPWKYVPLIM